MKSVHQMTDDEVRTELSQLISAHGFVRPARSQIDPNRNWKNGPPNYDRADLLYFRGRTTKHAEASLESVIENAIKSWEMEATHLQFKDWRVVDHARYRVSANGADVYEGDESAVVGNYNWLMKGMDKRLYDSEKEDFESSHKLFGSAFLGGFPFEVTAVFSGPPKVAFSWRHWARFEGSFRGRAGDGKVYELYGFGTLLLTEELKVREIEIFYKPDEFIQALNGEIEPEALTRGKTVVGSGCPFLSQTS